MKQSIKISPGWIEVPLRKLAIYIQRGKSPKYADLSDLPVINQKCVRWDGVNYDFVKYIHPDQSPKWAKERFLQCKDLLWNSTGTGTIGRACLYKQSDTPTVADSHITIVRAHQGCLLPEYLHYFIMSPFVQKQINEMQNGSTNQVELSKGTVEEMRLPVAPLAEQKRIVDKIELLFSYLDEGERLLEQVQKQISTYRQAVLKAAITGELTKEWRAENRDKVESGKELLQRILEERRKSWKGRGKYQELDAPDISGLPELPEGWVYATIDHVSLSVDYGSSSKCCLDSKGVPVLRMGNLNDGALDLGNLKFLPFEQPEFPHLFLKNGDLLFNRTNSAELVGKTAVYKGLPPVCSFASYLIRVRLLHVHPDLVAAYINSVYGKAWIRAVVSQQVGQANVNGSKLKALVIPIPPLKEQEQIANKLTQTMSQMDGLQDHCRIQFKKNTALRESILRTAFSGELVNQNPDDEPASELLVRIQEEYKQAKASNPRSGRTSKRSASV